MNYVFKYVINYFSNCLNKSEHLFCLEMCLSLFSEKCIKRVGGGAFTTGACFNSSWTARHRKSGA